MNPKIVWGGASAFDLNPPLCDTDEAPDADDFPQDGAELTARIYGWWTSNQWLLVTDQRHLN